MCYFCSSSIVGSQDRPTSSNNTPKVSIHVNHRSNGAITTHISSQNSGTVKIRPHSSKEFPALSSEPVPDVQWVKPGPSKEPKQKVHKVAPCPQLPPRNSPTDFPTLGKSDKSNKKSSVNVPINNFNDNFTNLTKESNSKSNKHLNNNVKNDFPSLNKNDKKKSSVTVPISGNSENLVKETKNKNNNNNNSVISNKSDFPSLSKSETKTKKSSVTVSVNSSNSDQSLLTKEKSNKSNNAPSSSKDNKTKINNNNNENLQGSNKNKKTAKKSTTNKSENDDSVKVDPQKFSEKIKLDPKQNGVVKKRSELKIDPLQVSDTNLINENDFPTLGNMKKPPGIVMQPPPGFAANNMTFTNSSGIAYSITPSPITQYIPPPNFNQRNRTLVEKFMTALDSNDKIYEFKQISNLFRSGDFPSESYYDHCKKEIGDDFYKIFPELLALLPDVQKQQELFKIHLQRGGSKKYLDVCATCNQVVTNNDLRSHLANHALENHFPVLGQQEISSVWKK